MGGCPEWSLHLDWYKGLDDWLKEELSQVEITRKVPAKKVLQLIKPIKIGSV